MAERDSYPVTATSKRLSMYGCPRHPTVQTTSEDGLFDAPCYICEGEMSEQAEAWDHDRDNPYRRYCGLPGNGIRETYARRTVATCVPDELPF
jgi:hypothetical protein